LLQRFQALELLHSSCIQLMLFMVIQAPSQLREVYGQNTAETMMKTLAARIDALRDRTAREVVRRSPSAFLRAFAYLLLRGHGVDVVEFCGCAGEGEAAEHFLVAVGAWGADDEGGGHEGR
jgi:hypothetical protein